MMRYFVDAALATRRAIAGNLDRLADRIAHDPAQTVANSLPMDPWFNAQEFMQDELLAEVLDAGSRVRIPVVRKAMFGFDRDRPEAALWAAREAGALITEVTNGQVSLVRDLVSSAQQGERTTRQVAREVRDSIGLTSDQAGWVSNRWGREFQARISDGMSLAAAEAAADKAAGLYYERVLRYRSETIARTEILRAAHEGRREAWSQGVDGGWINPGAQKQWMTVDDPCPECAAMDGETVAISGEFSVGEPPLHPNCRCDVLLVDEIPEDIQALTDEELDAQIEALLNEPAPEGSGDDWVPLDEDDLMQSLTEESSALYSSDEDYQPIADWVDGRAVTLFQEDLRAVGGDLDLLDPDAKAQVLALADKSVRLPDDATLYRVVPGSVLPDGLKPGDMIWDDAFATTAVRRADYEDFLEMGGPIAGDADFTIEIRAPRGTEGVWAAPGNAPDWATTFEEFVLMPGQKMNVVTVKPGKIVVEIPRIRGRS
jgi:hypothetical protein